MSGRVHGRLGRRLAYLMVLALLAACGGPAPSTAPAASTTPIPSSPGSGAPSETPGVPAASPQATETPAAWTTVQPGGLPQTATLVATKSGADSVARTTAFTLTSFDARSAVELARRVVADPPVRFVVSDAGGGRALLRPSSALAANTRYHLSLPRDDGTIAASWTAQTAGPLHLTDSVPGDHATGVPLDTGIELTFDQAGITTDALAAHLRIDPPVTGHYQVSGRSIAFVPNQPLRKATLYTVTVSKGLPVTGTGEVLPADAVIRFETGGTTSSGVRVGVRDALVDASPRERAGIQVWVDVPEGQSAPRTVPITVHRLATLSDAIAAWNGVTRQPDWTMVSTRETIPTAHLTRILSANVKIQRLDDDAQWLQLPRALPVGWYVMTVRFEGVPRQSVLQVTDTATYAVVTTTRTAVWVNDLRTGAPAVAATATLAGHGLQGTTNRQGLLIAKTPANVATATLDLPLLLVRYGGLTTFRPIDNSGLCEGCGKGGGYGVPGPARWWSLLTTDRMQYRSTDTVNVLGIAKQRSSGTVPREISLVVVHDDGSTAGIPIRTQTAAPDAHGMYVASVPIESLPVGNYWIRAFVGSDRLGETWFGVSTLRKPAYTMTVATDRHAVISGQPVNVKVGAAFFEGTPVAGVDVALRVDSSDEAPSGTLATDASGSGSAPVRPTTDERSLQIRQIVAIPTLPEEAEISATSPIAVFAGSAVVNVAATTNAKTVTITGGVCSVAFERYEAPGIDLASVDPCGAPRAGASVRVAVSAHTTRLVQSGTEYSFITKRVEPRYRTVDADVDLPSRTVRSGVGGHFQVVIPARTDATSYQVTATYVDEAGRKIAGETWADGAPNHPGIVDARLVSADGHTPNQDYSVGDRIAVTFTGGARGTPQSRYLFTTFHLGLASAVVQATPTYRTTFTAAAVPNIVISAVRFNGAGYEAIGWPYQATLDPADRTLQVTVAADQARYQPGGTATVSVTTRSPSGRPVAASVFVGAIDEKLFAMGAAVADDPVPVLYAGVPLGIIGTAQSHRTPAQERGGGGGDTTGGGSGGRTDFRDWLLSTRVQTDASGHATVRIPLSDDLTSWRVVATGLDAALDVGTGMAKLPVSVPFFVDAVLAPEYLASDRPVLRVRSYGAALPAGTPVTFTVGSDTLPMTETTVTAAAFDSAYVPLPPLSVGTHRLRITARAQIAGTTSSDTMTRTFRVVDHRATQLRTTWSSLTAATAVHTGTGMTNVMLVDAGRGRVVPVLEELAGSAAIRADQELAAALADRVLVDLFKLEPVASRHDSDAVEMYIGNGGLSIVSWGSVQLDVTALAAMAGDARVRPEDLTPLLERVASSSDETRARHILALAGLAALGRPVTDQLHILGAAPDLTVEEQVDLALAAFETGDEAWAGRLEQQLLREHGRRSANEVRIDAEAGSGTDSTILTARLAIVAASLGDPLATAMDAYIATHPSDTTLVVLERALAARGWAMRVPSSPAVAALTVDGQRQQISLQAGEAGQRSLTPAQARTAKLEPVSGQVLLVQVWDDALEPSTLTTPAQVSVTRSVEPSGDLPATATVVVSYNVTLPLDNQGACWQLIDSVPSGLAPITWYGKPTEGVEGPNVIAPSAMDGQRVEFCVASNRIQSNFVLRYVARVVTPGTYTWEPAVMQSTVDPSSGLTLPSTTITIRRPGTSGS